MAAIQFPNNPNAGDLFVASNGIQYTYDGEKWKTLGSATVGTGLTSLGQFLATPSLLTTDKVLSASAHTGAMGPMAVDTGTVLTVPPTAEFSILTGKSGSSQFESNLQTTGGTMTGFLTLNGDPTSSLHAATKQYVDSKEVTIVETPKALITNKAIGENLNAGMMGPTVAINPSITISVGANSLLFVLK